MARMVELVLVLGDILVTIDGRIGGQEGKKARMSKGDGGSDS